MATIFFFTCNFSCNFYPKVQKFDLKNMLQNYFSMVRFSLINNRIELNSDLKAIVEMTRSNISPQLHAKLLNCQASSCTMELAKQFHVQVFQQFAKQLHAQLLAYYANCWQKIAISPQVMFGNIQHYMKINRLSKSLFFKMLVHKYNFLLHILLKLMHTSHDFIAT